MRKVRKSILLVAAGLALLGAGLYLLKAIVSPRGMMMALPYVCVGLGCGLFGQGMGDLIGQRAIAGHPDVEKQLQIERLDERNTTISSRAKAKAYDLMIFVFGALMLSFSLMNVEMTVILLLVFAYLFVVGYGIYYRVKYDREM